MPDELDLIIIGAGCAGLSLGSHLAKLGAGSPGVLLLEQREFYENDRTWCFWAQDYAPFADLASHQWSTLAIASEQEKVFIDCAFTPYRILSSQHFYEHSVESIKTNHLLELRMGVNLLKEPQFQDGQWQLETSSGQLQSKMIVDTRPVAIGNLSGTTLWQSFVGYEVECEDAVFDALTATLMDFCKANAEYVGFNYLLPLSATRAIIEFTVFAKRPYYQGDLLSRLDAAVSKYIQGGNFQILRTESGVIPMGLTRNGSATIPAQAGYVHVGLTAGAARPATGYAFQRIQAWAAQCAKSIKENATPVAHREDAYLLRKMDAVFLNVIRNHPELGPELFMALFSKVNSRRLVRFLSDNGVLADYFAVIKALPSPLFLRDLLSFSYWR